MGLSHITPSSVIPTAQVTFFPQNVIFSAIICGICISLVTLQTELTLHQFEKNY